MTRIVLSGGRLLDGRTGEVRDADVAFDGNRVVAVGRGLDGDVSVDVAGKTVVPGLFDCHVHFAIRSLDWVELLHTPFGLNFFQAARNAEATLRQGITSVRDAHGADAGMRDAQRRGLIRSPRMQVSISMISQTGGHNDSCLASGLDVPLIVNHPGVPRGVVDGPVAARRKVRELVREGADVIKIAASGGVMSAATDPTRAQLDEDELEAIVREATRAGLAVMAHAHAAAGAAAAVRAGVRSIEHGSLLDDEAISLMAERGTWLVPTLSAARGVIAAAESGAADQPIAILDKARAMGARAMEATRMAREAGVRLAMGTDAPCAPHGTNLEELPLMAEAGCTPAEVWVASTSSAAELLGVGDRLGALEEGKLADAAVIDGDVHDLGGLGSRVSQVWQDGRLLVDRDADVEPPLGGAAFVA